MTELERALLNTLREVETWNQADMKGFEDTSPAINRPVLEARRDVIREALSKAGVS